MKKTTTGRWCKYCRCTRQHMLYKEGDWFGWKCKKCGEVDGDPSPSQIEQRAEKIRRGWSKREHERRKRGITGDNSLPAGIGWELPDFRSAVRRNGCQVTDFDGGEHAN